MSHIQALPDGTELVSDFRIERVLGAGGFGITYLAREIALGRHVTIKEYFPGDFAARGSDVAAVPRSEECSADYQWGLDRFIEEAQTLAKFDHPNIVRVYRYFRANKTGYMVLHFEEGKSLKGWLQALGRSPRQAELDRILAPLLDALAVVHGADFLHRDIAPDNIIIRNDGSPVLIDFGAARGEIARHSRTVSALVKPGYSPYEQYGEIGRQQGPWTDIYALAATLYHAITGKRPPDAPSRVVKDELIPARDAALSAYRPAFLKAIDQGLRIDIEKRPQNVAAWRAMLLEPSPEVGQRGWFQAKRSGDPAPTVAVEPPLATRPLPDPAAEPAGTTPLVPPPPDVPGRRGRIVDFLEGVRETPRPGMTAHQPAAAPAQPAATHGAYPQAPAAAAPLPGEPGQAPSAAAAVDKPNRLGGLFFRRQPQSPPQPPQTSAAIVPEDRPIDVKSAPVGAASFMLARAAQPAPVGSLDAAGQAFADKRARREPARRRPPRPRPVRTRSAWRWLSIGTKLAVGVAVAVFFVRLQQSLPRFEFRSTGTVASSSAERPPVAITGSTAPRSADTDRQAARPGREAVPVLASAAPIKKAPATLLLRTFEAHAGGTTAVSFADRGRKLATVGGDGTLRVWDTESYTVIRTLELEHGPAIALATLGKQALTGHENGTVALWDLESGMQLKTYKRNDAPIHALSFAGPNKFLAGAHDWSVALWETTTPSVPLHVFKGHDRDVMSLAYEPGRGLIASGSADKTVRLWESKSLSHLHTYQRSRDYITALAFSPDGTALLIGTLSGTISFYDIESRRRRGRFIGHKERITSLSFFDGGREFVSASNDGTVRLWNRRESRPLQTYGSAGAKISNAAVSPDGRQIAAGKNSGLVQIWNGAVLD